MAQPIDLSHITFIVMREMRGPLIALLCVFSISIIVMVFIPGTVGADGNARYMSIFDAFYFMVFTATTTGFGEIPYPFSTTQRFWAAICLISSVITWFYAIGSIIRLFQNPFFCQSTV